MKKIIQLTSGKGSTECEYFVGKTFEIMRNEMQLQNIPFRILQIEEGVHKGCFRTIILETEAPEVFLKSWKGSILYISKSKFRPNHKRKNWFIGIFEMEGFEKISINEKDLVFQTMRSNGPGGQNVNKVNSAVRATHIPTGISVQVMDSRSQLENKKLAVERIRLKILEINIQKETTEKENFWHNHLNLERGNPIRIFKE